MWWGNTRGDENKIRATQREVKGNNICMRDTLTDFFFFLKVGGPILEENKNIVATNKKKRINITKKLWTIFQLFLPSQQIEKRQNWLVNHVR